MNMSKREKVLGGAIIFLLVGGLLFRHGIFKVYVGVSSRKEELAKLEKTYKEYVDKKKNGPRIQRIYDNVVGKDRNPKKSSRDDPKKEFSEFVSDLCRRIGFGYPRIDPAKIEPIEGVDDYSFITLDVSTEGDRQSVAKLLKGFDHEAILIRQLVIDSPLDRARLDVTITVARLVQLESPQDEKKKEKPEKEAKGKPSAFQTRTMRKPLEEEEK